MLTKLREKIRAVIEDFLKSTFQLFIFSSSSIFTLAEPNIGTITSVLKNGVALGSGTYTFDSTTNKLTITAALNVNDQIEVNYTFNKYSNTELDEYIRASLVWISIYGDLTQDFELENSDIFPTPSNKEEDLITLIAAIIIKPDFISYKLPNLTVTYPTQSTKEERIQDLIQQFSYGIGVVGVIQWLEAPR